MAHAPRIGNDTTWMRRRGGQVLRETSGHLYFNTDGAFQWLLSLKELEIKLNSESCLEARCLIYREQVLQSWEGEELRLSRTC